MKTIFFLLLPLLFLTSCGHAPIKGKEVVGAEEFVTDSYRIREGKLSTLELSGIESGELSLDALAEYTETIEEGDTLSITLIQPLAKELTETLRSLSSSNTLVVRNQLLSLPDLDPLTVNGLTLNQAQELIQNAYDKLYRGSQVFLSFKERNSAKVYLSGLVNTSFLYADGKLRLFDALSLAKIPPNANLFRSYITRKGEMLPVDIQRLIKEGDMSQNIVLKGGDKIYIADSTSANIMVMGEVLKPVVLNITDGSLPIKKALAEAGGIPFTGNKSYIQVIRGSLQNPKIYTLNWKHIMKLPSNSMLLIPGDVVYVATTPLGEWNNFVTQILPTLIGADLIASGGKHLGIDVR